MITRNVLDHLNPKTHLFHPDDGCFFRYFEGVEVAVIQVAYQTNSSKGARSYQQEIGKSIDVREDR